MGKNVEFDRLLQQEELILKVTELICEALHDRGVTQADIASALDMKASEVSQRLSGERNLTLRSVADLLYPLQLRLEPHLVDIGHEVAESLGGVRMMDEISGPSRYTETGIRLSYAQ